MKSQQASFLSFLMFSCLLMPLDAANGQVSPVFVRDYPQSYIVQDGDTIAQIAGQFLEDPTQWSEFWLPTPYREDGSQLRVGDVVRVEFINGRARLVAQRGNIQLERLEPQMREIAVTSAIPAIPLDDIQSAFTKNRIVDQQYYDSAPYIVSPMSKNLVIGTGDQVYARGDWPSEVTTFDIYREVTTFPDPDDNRNSSMELITVGTARVVGEESDDVKRLQISASDSEIKIGDRLLTTEEVRFDSIIYPTEPNREIFGRVIAMTNTERMASQLDSVLISVGSRDGLEIGNVLALKQTGEQVVDDTGRGRMSLLGRIFASVTNQTVEMPRQEVGTLLVYRVFENLSYGVILTSSEPARLGDMVVNP